MLFLPEEIITPEKISLGNNCGRQGNLILVTGVLLEYPLDFFVENNALFGLSDGGY